MAQDMGYRAEILRRPVGEKRPPLIGRSRERDRRSTAEELERLRKRWRGLPRQQIPMGDIAMADIVDFAVATAWWLSEITGIRWKDINMQDRTVMIRDRKDPRQKLGNNQIGPLLGDAWTIVSRQSNTDERVFPYRSESISTSFTRACQALGIEDLHFHDLRHEGTSRLFVAGYQIPERAGHDWSGFRRVQCR